MKSSNVQANARWLIVLIVDSVVANLHLMQGAGFNPDDENRTNRASAVMDSKSSRLSRLSVKSGAGVSWEDVHAARQKEAEVISEALKLMTQKETVRKQMLENISKQKAEAALDKDIRATLIQHGQAEAEVQKAKKLVKYRMTML